MLIQNDKTICRHTDSVQAISLSKDILSESNDDTESLSEPLESEDVLSDAKEFDECKTKLRTEVKLIYEFDHVDDGHESPMVAAIEAQNVQETIDDKVSLSQLQKECPDFSAIYTYLSLGELPDDRKLRDKVVSESKYFSLSDGVLNHWYQRRCRGLAEEFKRIKQIALPKCLRLDALKSYHDSLASGGHIGREKVYNSLMEKYWWNNMHQNVIDYVKSCDRCQKAKQNCNPNRPPLTKMPQVGRFDRWHIDVLGPLTKSPDGYEYVLLVVDAFSRWCEGFPMKTQNAKEIAENLYNGVVTRYGSPRVLCSDRGQAFLSKIVKAICEIFQITQHHTSSYHPNTNGTVERQNHTLAQSLRTYCNESHDKWPSLIPSIMMAFRRSVSSATGFSPFYMMFGQDMKIPFDIALEPKDNLPQDTKTYLNQFISNIKVAHTIAHQNEAVNKEKDKVRHDEKAKTQTFAVGDLVLIKVHKFPTGMSRKLCDKAEGPYHIEEIGPNHTYALRRQSDQKKHKSLMNATNLQLYTRPEPVRQRLTVHPPNQNDAPEPDSDTESLEDDAEIQDAHDNVVQPPPQPVIDPLKKYTFKEIIEGRRKQGRREMYVKWLDNTNTWEPDTNFDQDMLDYINSRWTKKGKRKKSLFKP